MAYTLKVRTKNGDLFDEAMALSATIADVETRCKAIGTEGYLASKSTVTVTSGKYIYYPPVEIDAIIVVEI